MEPTIAVGLESTIDILITFPQMDDFKEFARECDGELAPHVKRAYETIANGSGGEVPIDGKKEEAEDLLSLAEDRGAEINCVLGGNGAQEAVTLGRLGSETIFLGAVYPESFSKLPSEYQGSLENTDMTYARILGKYAPASYIFQAVGTNRYILTQGEGRRIDQLGSYLRDLPDILQEVIEAYDGLHALSLVGWQVLFGNKLSEKDFQIVTRVIDEIREETDALLFTDAGGIGTLDEREEERLCNIYSSFDILSMNEDEMFRVSEVLASKGKDEFWTMSTILEESRDLSTVWLHTPSYQSSLSGTFSRSSLEKAQENSALAGVYKVEKGGYPTMEDLSILKKTHNFSGKGLEKREAAFERYGKKIDGRELVVTPCYEVENFFSTVGAGDVSSAAFLYYLIKSKL